MKLDRNKNWNGRGKYALINLRALSAQCPEKEKLLDELQKAGVLTYGNESPEAQFFVMKWGDKFTPGGLEGYLSAVNAEIGQRRTNIASLEGVVGAEAEQLRQENQKGLDGLIEWAAQIDQQKVEASRVSSRIPD